MTSLDQETGGGHEKLYFIFQGRTIGEFIREDPNIEGVHVGVKDDEIKNLTTVAPPSTMFLYKDSLTPAWAGK